MKDNNLCEEEGCTNDKSMKEKRGDKVYYHKLCSMHHSQRRRDTHKSDTHKLTPTKYIKNGWLYEGDREVKKVILHSDDWHKEMQRQTNIWRNTYTDVFLKENKNGVKAFKHFEAQWTPLDKIDNEYYKEILV